MTPEIHNEVDIRKYKRHLRRQQVVRRDPLPFGEVVRAWRPLRGILLVAAAFLVMILLVRLGYAADNDSTSLPDAPSALYVQAALPQAAPQAGANWLARAAESKPAYSASQWFLIGATAADAVMTYRALTHPTHLTGSYYNSDAGLWVNPNVDLTGRFSETGWARFVGPRNPGGVIAANVALNAGVLLLSHELAKKGPRWRAVATALNAGKAADTTFAACSWRAAYRYADSLPVRWGYPVQSLAWQP